MNGIDELSEIVRLRTGTVDAQTLEKLRLHVADTIGAWIAATQTAEGKALVTFRDRTRAMGQTGVRNLHDDLATHCALVRLSEIDDIHLSSMTTPGSVAVPAALTMAAALPEVDIGDVTAAILAGYEAMIRLGLAIKGPDVLYRGIWPTYFAAGFATAAVAARLMRFDQKQTTHALALSLTMASPSVSQHHPVTTARWFSVGNAARNGFVAALAAQAGFTADVDILRSRVFPDVYAIEPDLAAMTGDSAFAFSQVSFKPWCAARQTMAATQALRETLDTGISANDLSEVVAYVLPPHLKMIDHGVKPGDRASYLTSLPFQLALAALQPTQMADLNLTVNASSQSLQAFMSCIKVVADEKLLADYPASWPARVVVTTSSSQYERRVDHVPGDPARAFAEANVRRKFQHFVAPVLGDATATIFQKCANALHSREGLLSLMQDLQGAMSRGS
jgi:2-methylcitrate dehydratase PrpD